MLPSNPNAKGAIAELKVATAATCLGIPVLRPRAEHGRYDLAFDIGRRILRIQCKWARRRGDVIIVNLTSSYLTKTREVRASYGIDEIDAVAVYCADLDTCYLLPVELVAERRAIQLRVSPPKNAQIAALN